MARKRSENSKHEKIEIRVTHEQKKLLKQLAHQQGITLSNLLLIPALNLNNAQ